MVTTSLVDGIIGAVSWYARVVGVGWTQVPDTTGANVGMALCRDTGAEKVRVMPAFDATF